MKKNIKKVFIKIAVVKLLIGLLLFSTQYAIASDFNLNSQTAGNMYEDNYKLSSDIPMPNKALQDDSDDMIGLNLSIRIPYPAIKKAFLKATEAEIQNTKITIMDKKAPVIFKSGESLKINNIRVDIGGIIAEPELTFKPYGISRDVLGIKIERAKLHVSMMPDKSMAPQLTQEEIMEKIINILMKTLMDELAKQLSTGNLPVKAEDIVTLSYDKAQWLLRGELHTEFVRNFLPPTLVGDVHFTGFSINDSAIMVNVGTGK
jgi:hypothetical protein